MNHNLTRLCNHCQDKGFLDPRTHIDALGFMFEYNNINSEQERIDLIEFIMNEIFPSSTDEISQFMLSTLSELYSDGKGKLFSIINKNSYVPKEY